MFEERLLWNKTTGQVIADTSAIVIQIITLLRLKTESSLYILQERAYMMNL